MLRLQNAGRGHLLFLRRRHRHIRTFVNARIKWVRDPYLDTAVEREKNLKPLLSLKDLILSHPSQTLPISSVSPLKPHLQIPTTARTFFLKYPLIFKIFLPPHKPNSLPHVKLTPRLLSLHQDEILILDAPRYRKDVAERLVRLLMIARAGKLPLYLIDMFKYDLGLPHDYLSTLLLEFPDYFSLCNMGFRDSSGSVVLGLELVSWRDDLAVSVVEKRAKENGETGTRTKFSMNLPRGFDLEKKVVEWLDEWHKLPYISPYENAFHLIPNSDQAEKWAVAVIHELLSLLVSKKTERENVFRLGDFLGFGRPRLKRALVHFPGIFYVSNKIKTQTVVLREEYRKSMLVGMHPLMLMRNKYISLMNLVLRRGKPRIRVLQHRKGSTSSSSTRGKKKDDQNRYTISDNDID
ncbi:protein WHAT'S THIS FACTOR 9, mitochondrial-like [Henckelia pumila]|uniref:protein WHAT'S THIS FACTOR 9, mitochondrial-like n=1 Tax=Henckelia pumila TaxID=405737 RepID=UPI003C6DC076